MQYNLNGKGKGFHAYSDSTFNRGGSILFSEKLNANVMNVKRSLDGKILINLEMNKKFFTIINVYATNEVKKRWEFFQKL